MLALRALHPSQAHVAVADDGDTGPGPDADSDDFEISDLMSINLGALSITRPISAKSIAYSSYAMSMILSSWASAWHGMYESTSTFFFSTSESFVYIPFRCFIKTSI